jgi:hypothetical protein
MGQLEVAMMQRKACVEIEERILEAILIDCVVGEVTSTRVTKDLFAVATIISEIDQKFGRL